MTSTGCKRTLLENFTEVLTAVGNQAVVGDATIQRFCPGSIAIEDGMIVDVGPPDQVLARSGQFDERIDMTGKSAIPGMIDPHTHLVFAGDRCEEFNRRLHGATYVDIAKAGGGIKSTVRATRAATQLQLEQRGIQVLNQMLMQGVTTIEAKSGYGLDHATEIKQLDAMRSLSQKHPVEMVQTFMGAHEIPAEFEGRPADYIDYLNQDLLPEVKARGDVTYVDIFCERGVFELEDSRRHLERACELGFGVRLHADELVHMGGSGLAAEVGAISADHLVYADRKDMERMAEAGVMATLLPGTSFFLRGNYADAKAFREAGCAIALSTDFNPGSSHTCSQSLMMALGCMNLGMTFEQSFVGVTLNAAAAIQQAHRLGTLEVGKSADIAILDTHNPLFLVYNWGINHVEHVMKAGNWVVKNRLPVQAA